MKGAETIHLLAAVLIAFWLSHPVMGQVECIDPDIRDTVNKTQKTMRENMTAMGLYCDLALSWNVSKSMALDPTSSTNALNLYKQIYAKVLEKGSMDSDRTEAPNRDCLAILYKTVCAHTIPFCSQSQVVITANSSRSGTFVIHHVVV